MHFMILEKTEDSTMVAILLQAAAATVEVYLWEKWTRTVSRWRPPSNSASCRLYGCLIFSILLNLMFPLLFCMVHCTVCILYKVYAVPDDPTLRFLNVPKNKTRKTTLLLSNQHELFFLRILIAGSDYLLISVELTWYMMNKNISTRTQCTMRLILISYVLGLI